MLEDLDASMATDWSDFCRVTDSDFTTMCTCKDAHQSFYFEKDICMCQKLYYQENGVCIKCPEDATPNLAQTTCECPEHYVYSPPINTDGSAIGECVCDETSIMHNGNC